ncbi:MAG TPA: PIN domain-containing protein [Solirubrobacteraceae bacterium]|nr:PIN domain-containing protein [Solirubrobacteraceae bacterium]
MGVVVFDSDVLIAFLNRQDGHHAESVQRVRDSLSPGNRRLICAVNYAEIMVGPVRAGTQELVRQMLVQFNIETITVDMALANRAAVVRARTGLKLPDAFALATAVHAEHRGWEDVEMASFDAAVLRAHRDLHPN